MSDAIRFAVLASFLLILVDVVGCSSSPSDPVSDSANPAEDYSVRPEENSPDGASPEVAGGVGPKPDVTQPANDSQRWADFDAIVAAAPKKELAEYELEFGKIVYLIDAPPGGEVKKAPGGNGLQIKTPDGFTLTVKTAATSMLDRRRVIEKIGASRNYLFFDADTMVTANTVLQDSGKRFESMHRERLGYRDFTISTGDYMTEADALLACRCAATLRLKEPLPTDPVALAEALGVSLKREGEDIIGVSTFGNSTSALFDLYADFSKLATMEIHGEASALAVEDFAKLQKLTALRTLEIEPELNGAFLPEIAKLGQLQTLILSVNRVSADDLATLASLKNLTHLQLEMKGCDYQGLAFIAELPLLENLELEIKPDRDVTMAEDALAFLSRAAALRSLNVSYADLTDEQLAAVSEMPQLETLSIQSGKFQGEIWATLGKSSKLRDLSVEATYGQTFPMSASAFAELGKINLVSLTMDGASFEPDATAAATALMSLESLEVGDANLSDADLTNLAGIKSLTSLKLGSGNAQLTDEGKNAFKALREDVRLQ